MPAGLGYNFNTINATVATLAKDATALKAKAADIRAWFDRLSTGTDDEAATALRLAVESNGGTLPQADALLLIRAMREVTFFAATFAPTYTLDVRGPSALI